MAKANILVVEDKFIVAQDIATTLRKLGYTVSAICSSGEEALQKSRESQPRLILMDIRLKGDMDGIEAAGRIRSELGVPIIYLTAHSDEDTLERAQLTEPYGYLLKPFDERQLYITLQLALNRPRVERSNFLKDNPDVMSEESSPDTAEPSEMQSVVTACKGKPEFSNIVGRHSKLLQLLHNVELVAKTDVTVHIYGENGTGKELIADALHRLSARSSKPLVKLNCSAIPANLLESALFGHSRGAFTGASKDQEGFIERAQGGTLFLDEIGDISLDIQVKLLRVLQTRDFIRVGETVERTADIRLITATNKDLADLVKQGKIREDFYYRINVFPIDIPPLRERGDDILALGHHFRILFNKMFSRNIIGFTREAEDALLAYRWPGNVRQLENAMRRAFVLIDSDTIDLRHLPHELSLAEPAPVHAVG